MDGHIPQVLPFKDKMPEVFRMKLLHEKGWGRKPLIVKLVFFYNVTLDTLNLIS